MSNKMDIDYKSYFNNLEELIGRLREEVSEISQPIIKNNGQVLPDIDRYIYELNQFYYQSFHEHFFPDYQKKIKEDVSHLLKVCHQEDMLRKDVLASVRRYARLFNQVKTIISFLQQLRKDNNKKLLSLNTDNDYRLIELFYSLTKVRENLQELFSLSQSLTSLAEEKEFLLAIRNHPGYIPVLRLISSLDITNPYISGSLDKVLINLQYLKKLLARLQATGHNQESLKDLAGEINNGVERFKNKPVDKEILAFYEQNVVNQLPVYVELITFYIDINNLERISQLAYEYEQNLSCWISFIEKGLAWAVKDARVLLSAVELAHTSEEYVPELHKDVSSTLVTLQKIIEELSSTSKADFNYFSQKTMEMLDFAVPLFKAINTEKEIIQISPLASLVNRIVLELAFLRINLDLLSEKHQQAVSVIKDLEDINVMLDTYLQLLANNQSDLERILAPHNIARFWKDLNIKIDRVPLETGKLFPVDYLYLIDKHNIETRIAEEEDNTVLHEEGDIFLIRIDDESETEIPYLVIAAKG
ncbi:MAG: hypothetical protein PHT79_08685 [Syntrophomonadaceae bacterium]|nr:hypothetical protein [Syntrophomonadaceae bacterium]MDD3889189.1 hypothetical protein [Syntrophomonadaceae bacterium]MDD4549816.1 hypothetical protein [Syntrophomonadaceae bacterium]